MCFPFQCWRCTYHKAQLTWLFFALFLTACSLTKPAAEVVESTPTPESPTLENTSAVELTTPDAITSPTATVTPVATLLGPSGVAEPILLADLDRYTGSPITWMPDSRYLVWGSGAYDVWEQQLVTPETLSEPSPVPSALNTGNLPEYRLAFWSPEGQRAVLFLTEGEIITQEAHSGFEGGEGSPLCLSSDVALWTAAALLPLGRIEHCLPDSLVWAQNGESALLSQFAAHLPHRYAAWLLDFRREEIVPFNQSGRAIFRLPGFGPAEQSVLYGVYRDSVGDQQLYLYDIVKQETRELAQPVHFVFDWFTDDTVLAACYGGSLGSNHPLGIFQLADGQCQPLGIDLAGQQLGQAVLSPDKLWLAFKTVAPDRLQGKLWLAAVRWGDEQN